MKEQTWPKSLTVDKRIVKILSGSTYENFPKALREIIINAYDADAENVKVKVDLDDEYIRIDDDGRGMSETDFDFYLRIAFMKREKDTVTKTDRKIVGQFGVGFLSVFPFCKRYRITSTKSGSDEVIHADIPCEKYFSRSKELIDVDRIQIPGGKRISKAYRNKHYTRIEMMGFTDLTNEFLFPQRIKAPNKFSIKNYMDMDKLKWILEEDLPIEYEDPVFEKAFGYKNQKPFIVKINGAKLKRKVFGDTILEKHEEPYSQIGEIKFKYFISTNYSVIHPTEARFLKQRNLNVGVGPRDSFGAGTESGTRASLTHLTGEIHLLDGLNHLIALDREKFNYSADYERLKEFFKKKLVNLATRVYALEQFLKYQETVNPIRVTDINLLDSKFINQKLENLEKDGFKVTKLERGDSRDGRFVIDKEEKTIKVYPRTPLKHNKLKYQGKTYRLTLDGWDFSSELFSAVKLTGNKIVINKEYPLFKGKKYTDIFIRIHVLFLMDYLNGDLRKPAFKKLTHNLLSIFSDYIP